MEALYIFYSVVALFILLIIIILAGVGKQGKPLQSDAREIVCNVHKFFEGEFDALKNGKETLSVAKVLERTACATGVSKRTVSRILNEHKMAKQAGTRLGTPGKKRPNRTPKKTIIDSFTKSAIRRTIYQLYESRFLPSLNDMKEALNKAGLFDCSKWALREIFKKMKFRYLKNNKGRKMMMERSDIVVKRFNYLRKMRDLRNSLRPIIYLDETWINVNHTKGKIWMCEDSDGKFESPLCVPLGKGQRFIVLHAGSECGFVPNGLLLFKSKTNNYHEEMEGNVFKNWFVNTLLPNIPQNAIIVMRHTIQ